MTLKNGCTYGRDTRYILEGSLKRIEKQVKEIHVKFDNHLVTLEDKIERINRWMMAKVVAILMLILAAALSAVISLLKK